LIKISEYNNEHAGMFVHKEIRNCQLGIFFSLRRKSENNILKSLSLIAVKRTLRINTTNP